jgi:hypothetical protein
MEIIITPKEEISKFFREKGMDFLKKTTEKRMEEIILMSSVKGNSGKTSDYAESGKGHRTTYGYFLSKSKWDEEEVSKRNKNKIIEEIFKKAEESGEIIYIKVDDTISKKKPPSSKAEKPTEKTGWHYSHLDKKTVFGHQLHTVMISCGNLSLCYSMKRYDKEKCSKIDMTINIINELPDVRNTKYKCYALLDSWYTSARIINSFKEKGYEISGAVKINRVIYPNGKPVSISNFAANIPICDFRLVTVNNKEYYTYKYTGKLNNICQAVVIISYPKDKIGFEKALKAFISTDMSSTVDEILNHYSKRWEIEVFFKQMKKFFGLDKFMIRSVKAIDRFFVILSLAHFFYVTGLGSVLSFSDGVRKLRSLFSPSLFLLF